MKKKVSLLMVLAMLLTSFAACSETTTTSNTTTDTPAATDTPADATTEEVVEEEPVEEVDTRFDNINYGGKSFRVYSSVDESDATNGDAFIHGSGELNGEIVNDAVFHRNEVVSEKLNINLEFIDAKYSYSNLQAGLKKEIMAGDDAYDVMANDLRDFAALSYQGFLVNVYNSDIIDLDRSYWNRSAMEDLMIVDGGLYVVVGDYFMDAIQSCHVLFTNETELKNRLGDGEYINKLVMDGKWTFDTMYETIESTYADTDGDGTMNEGDFYGFVTLGTWGAAIPFMIAPDTQFVERTEDGGIQFCFNNERSVEIIEKMNKIFHSDGSNYSPKEATTLGTQKIFSNSGALMLGYSRLGHLANFREIEFAVGCVPYPKLNDAQENYVSSMHDITEVGAIPGTVPTDNYEFVFTCLEALSAETAKTVLPEYYENALKVKYVDGADDAVMIDLIHDSIGSPFAVAFDSSTGNIMLQNTFSSLLGQNSNDFASAYKKGEKAGAKALDRLLTTARETAESQG